MVNGLSHTPPLLFVTLFHHMSSLILIMSLLLYIELKLTRSVLPTNCLNLSLTGGGELVV